MYEMSEMKTKVEYLWIHAYDITNNEAWG